MDVRRVPSADLGEIAAAHVAELADQALADRDEFIVAFSGGTTPAPMLDALAVTDLDWSRVHILQTDERVVPDDDPDRNMALLDERLLGKIKIPRENVHPMPVTLDDLDGALRAYRAMLRRVAGDPPVADVVHLGIGSDGHVASLFPGSESMDNTEREVVLTGEHGDHRRMTVTLPFINRARRRLWLIAGEDKREAAAKLLAGDEGIPAGRVRRDASRVIIDDSADPEADPAASG